MKKSLLLLFVCLFGALSGVKAWTAVNPENGKSYYLYNIGENAYWYGTNGEYGTKADIADASLVTVEYVSETNFKLAFVHGKTTYRIYQNDGTRECNNTSGVEFWTQGSTSAYEIRSKNPSNDNTRVMNSGGWFPKHDDSKRGNVTWQFIAKEEVENACATAAQLNNVMPSRGWERVTTLSQLQDHPENYTFAIYSANVQDLMVQVKDDTGRAKFATATEALASDYNLYEIQNYTYGGDPYFVMKSKGTNGYFYPTTSWQLDAPSTKTVADDNCRLTFEVSTNGVWRVKSLCLNDDGSYWGLWTPVNGYKNGEELAGNKVEGIAASLLIYRLSKDITPISNLTAEGWTSGVANNSSSTEGTWDKTYYLTSYNQVWRGSWEGNLNDGIYSHSFTPSHTGKYKLSAWVRLYKESEGQETYSGATMFAGSNEVNVCEGGALYNTNKCHLGQYNVEYDATAGEAFNFGFKLQGANFNWLSFKNVNVTYLGETLATAATAFTSGNDATAGTWYSLDIPANGNYMVTTSVGTTLYYTQNSSKCVNDDDFPNLSFNAGVSKNLSLSSGTFYFKSVSGSTVSVVRLTNGTDVTSFIKNPSFTSNTEGWLGDGSWKSAGGVESFNSSSIDFYQTLNDMPAGYYKVGAQVFYRAGNKNTINADRYVKIYANIDDQADVMNINQYQVQTSTTGLTGTWIQPDGTLYYVPDNVDAANYALNTLHVYNNNVVTHVNDGTLTIGIKKDGSYGDDWAYWDNFTLVYYDNAEVASLAASFTSGSNIKESEWYAYTVPVDGWYTITPSAAGTFKYTQSGTISVMDGSFCRFYAPVGGKFLYLTAGKLYFSSNSAGTVTIVATSLSEGDDATGYINDPSFEHVALDNNNIQTSTDMMDWVGTLDASEAFISYKINDRIMSPMDGQNLYNTWGGSPANGFYLEQTLQNLPQGEYALTCYVASSGNATVKVAFGGEDVDVECGNDGAVAHLAAVTLNNSTDGNVLIKLSSTNWFKADDFHLTYVGPYHEIIVDDDTNTQVYYGTYKSRVDLTPTEEHPFVDITHASFDGDVFVNLYDNPNGLVYATPSQVSSIKSSYGTTEAIPNVVSNVGNVCESLVIYDGHPFFVPSHSNIRATKATYSRDIAAASNFGTICLPYEVESDENIQYYTTSVIEDNVLKLTEVDNVAAGTPAIFKKKDGEATEITVAANNVSIASDAGTNGSSVVLRGTFERITIGTDGATGSGAANGKYYINSSNQFCEGKDWFYVGAFRAYLEADGNNPARLSISVDDEATAINELKTLDEELGLKDGKYLIGGKIIVVKNGVMYSANGQKLN